MKKILGSEGEAEQGEGEAPTWRGPKALATVLPDEHEHPNPMIMNSTGFLPLRAPAGAA